MYPIDAKAEHFEAVEILGIPGLFTTGRVDRKTIPPGMYAYDMQTSENDWLQPCLLARHIHNINQIAHTANGKKDINTAEIAEAVRLIHRAWRLVKDTL